MMKALVPALALLFSAGIAEAACYEFTCTSLAGAKRAVQGETDANGVLVQTAPSGKSAWVFQVRGNRLRAAQNCFPDQEVDGGNVPSQSGSDLCRSYGPSADVPGATYSYGAWNKFKSCTRPVACN